MNKLYVTIAAVFLLLSSFVFVSAQDDGDKVFYNPPPQPAYVFDEYNPNTISAEDERQKLELFVLQFKDIPYSRGYARVYRGLSDYKFDYQKQTDKIDGFLNQLVKNSKINSYDVYTRFSGFRNESTIELIIEPPGNKISLPSSNISLLDVKYYDDATLEKGTIQKTGQELLNSLINRVEPPFPAAARAVRASGEVAVLTKIDEKGNVIEANAFFGHPLLRAACTQAVKQWQFKPEIRSKIPVKVVGITICEFKPVESEQLNY